MTICNLHEIMVTILTTENRQIKRSSSKNFLFGQAFSLDPVVLFGASRWKIELAQIKYNKTNDMWTFPLSIWKKVINLSLHGGSCMNYHRMLFNGKVFCCKGTLRFLYCTVRFVNVTVSFVNDTILFLMV